MPETPDDDLRAPRTEDQRRFALPEDATELLVVRHGATTGHDGDSAFPVSADGHGDPALAEAGEAQAELVGERLARERIDRLFVTSLRRTRQTAAPLVRRTGLEPEVVADLREVHLGDWEHGEYRVRIAARDPLVMRVWQTGDWSLIPGAERTEGFRARIARGLEHCFAETGPGNRAVVVVHGGVIAEIGRAVTQSSPVAFLGAENTSITRLVRFSFGHTHLRTYNDVAHLDGLRAAATA